jgi:hypothetical protein
MGEPVGLEGNALLLVPWHVSNAEIRVPVSISSESAMRALGRIPPDVYLSELKAINGNID